MDKIIIRELRVETIVGIWAWERRMPQIVSLDIDIGTDISDCLGDGGIENTIDYKQVSRRVTAHIQEMQYELLEALTEGVAGIVLNEFGAPWVKVRAIKPKAVRDTAAVGVVIERSADRDATASTGSTEA